MGAFGEDVRWGRPGRSRTLVAAAALAAGLAAIGVTAANAGTGALTYKGCITGDTQSGPVAGGGSGACAKIGSATLDGVNSGLDVPYSAAVSSDGRSLYAVSADDDAISRFQRNLRTGALTYKGCITGELQSGPPRGGSGACAKIPSASPGGANSGLDSPLSLALSEDGTSLYVAAVSDAAVARFKRNTTTGVLAYKGCITGEKQSGPVAGGGSGACAKIPSASSGGADSGLASPYSVAVSGDGHSVYAAARTDDAVARFRRDTRTGALTYKKCITGEKQSGPAAGGGSGACSKIPSAAPDGDDSGLDVLSAVVVSDDGHSIYAVSQGDRAIARFTHVRRTGAFIYKGCLTGEIQSGPLAAGGSGACAKIPSASSFATNSGLDDPVEAALSSDRRSLYAAGYGDDAVARFHRDRTSGALTYKNCITGDTQAGPVSGGGSGACAKIPSAASNGANSGLDQLDAVAVSDDGKSLYAAAFEDDAISRFQRNLRTGALTYEGCITGELQSGPPRLGSGACAKIPSATSNGTHSGLDVPTSVAVTDDRRSLYATTQDDAIARFKRSP